MEKWLSSITEGAGYPTFFLLMVLENIFPPLPSEVIMTFGGIAAAKSELNLAIIIAVCSAGQLVGTSFWYGLGKWLGREKLLRWAARNGRWLTLTPQEVKDLENWFQRHGWLAVVFGRLLPGIGTLVSLPAGMLGMPFKTFLAYSTAFITIWTLLIASLVFAGRAIQPHPAHVQYSFQPCTRRRNCLVYLPGHQLPQKWLEEITKSPAGAHPPACRHSHQRAPP